MRIAAVTAIIALAATTASAAELKDTQFINDRIVALHFDELVSYRWHTLGGNGQDGQLQTAPLDLTRASLASTYQVNGAAPAQIGRKSRPHTFIRAAGGERHAMEHLIYLVVPQSLKPGTAVTIALPPNLVSSGPTSTTLTFDPTTSISPAIQANHLGYLPNAQKIALVSTWAGDLGGIAFHDGTPFQILSADTRKPAFSGKLAFRKKASGPDSGQPDEGNYYRTDLYECDFTALTVPGKYILSLDGVGASMPFEIGPDVYRQAYLTAIRGMYHQRCGTALAEPYTKWTRPLCHHPSLEPLRQTDHRYMDAPFSDGPTGPFKETGEFRADIWGGWHDAGDWDRESNHINIPSYMLLAYEMTPQHYGDGELNIPESGNGIPDLLDEARWGVDYFLRVQRPDGGVSVGFFESRWPNEAEVSSTDTLKKYCYAEEPVASYRQAAAAAHLARVMKSLGKADESQPYATAAQKAYAWADANLRPGDQEKSRDDRLHAAAALFRLTGDATYQDAFKHELQLTKPTDPLYAWQKYDQQLGVWAYALADQNTPGLDRELHAMLRQACINYALSDSVATSEKRGNRRGYNWYYPFSWGRGAQTNNMILMVAHHLSRDPRLLDVMVANANLTLGTNPLNMTWVTGLGYHSPRQVMQINFWYDEKGPNPGVTPMGPTRYSPKDPKNGVWLPAYQMQFVYPAPENWPPLELWFENRLCPPTNEFVVAGQAEAGISFGYLCAPAR